MDDTIWCRRCSKDVRVEDYIQHRDNHTTGFRVEEVSVDRQPEPYDPDTYTPPWRKGTVSMDGGQAPSYNTHMVQVQPRNNVRSAALDEAVERERSKPAKRRSNLIR